jgi:hypothetical protein
VHAAVIGKRSGEIAIAPTMRVALSLTTASAAMTPAAAINAKYRAGRRARMRALLRTSAHTSADDPSASEPIVSSRTSAMSSG